MATASVTYTILPADLSEVTVKQTGTLTANGSAQTPTVSADAVSVNSQPVTFTYSKEEKGTYGAFLHLQRQVIIPCISRHPHRITRTRPAASL